MIKLEARIKLFDSSDGDVDSVSVTNGNNISSTSNIAGKEVEQGRPFIFGSTPLVGGVDSEVPNYNSYYMTDNAGYFIGSTISNENGELPSPYTITINGTGLNAITLVFDKENNVYPTELTVNNTVYTNDDTIFTVGNLGGLYKITITINKLNKAGFPLVLLGAYVVITITVNEKNLDSFNYNIYDREYNEEPSYGIISNSGTLSFIDSDGEVLEYAQQGLLTKDLAIKVYVTNSLYESKQDLFISCSSDSWEYDNYNFVANVSLKDELLDLQNYTFKGLPYDGISLTGKEIYNLILEDVPERIVFPEYDSLDEQTKSRLLMPIQFPYMESCSVWDAFDSLCKTYGLRIFKEKDYIVVRQSA